MSLEAGLKTTVAGAQILFGIEIGKGGRYWLGHPALGPTGWALRAHRKIAHGDFVNF